jgi:hypothetical protein
MARRRSVAARTAFIGVLTTAAVLAATGSAWSSAPAKTAKKPTISISGDFKVKSATTLRCLQLQKFGPTIASRTVALSAPPAKKPLPGDGSYELDLGAMTIGGPTTLPAASTGNPSTTPNVRFSYNTNGDYLDWGGPRWPGR